MARAAGEWLLLCYDDGGPLLYHERRLLCDTAFFGWSIVLTPDFDVYAEECDGRNVDLFDIKATQYRGDRGGLGPAVPIYAFTLDADADGRMPQWRRDAAKRKSGLF